MVIFFLTAEFAKNKIPAKGTEFLKNPDAPNASYRIFRDLFTDDELLRLGWEAQSQKSKVKGQTNFINDLIVLRQGKIRFNNVGWVDG